MPFHTPFCPSLVPAVLLRRYKRFLADVRLADGSTAIAHCPNPGSMLGLATPGAKVWLQQNSNPRRKLRYGWCLLEHTDGHFTGIDTMAANRVLRAALPAGAVAELRGYNHIAAEVRYGRGSRVDFLLSGGAGPACYVEVKSVTLSRVGGRAEFPDSITARGTKHLHELAAMAGQGYRAVIFYLVQRTDTNRMALAADIDAAYARAFEAAQAAGVEALAYGCQISPLGINLGAALPFRP
ncbi:MAG: DNA/RNA nuclease SfsA [Rhodobacteraceae bacterium]|nr:DNA/RNA nuclease SfsA [Paracoccaceae bacterium]